MLLDLEIRRSTNGAKSLDDVMRRLYTEFYKRNRNYTPEDFQKVAEQEAKANLDRFFSMYVHGREELDYNTALAAVGLRLDTTGNFSDAKTTAGKAYLGATLAQEGERLVVKNVPAGTPAYHQGLSANDQIVAINDQRATLEFLNARLDERQPGDSIRLAVFRQDDLRTFDIKLGRREQGDYRIVMVSAPSPEQMRLYQGWLNAPYPRAK